MIVGQQKIINAVRNLDTAKTGMIGPTSFNIKVESSTGFAAFRVQTAVNEINSLVYERIREMGRKYPQAAQLSFRIFDTTTLEGKQDVEYVYEHGRARDGQGRCLILFDVMEMSHMRNNTWKKQDGITRQINPLIIIDPSGYWGGYEIAELPDALGKLEIAVKEYADMKKLADAIASMREAVEAKDISLLHEKAKAIAQLVEARWKENPKVVMHEPGLEFGQWNCSTGTFIGDEKDYVHIHFTAYGSSGIFGGTMHAWATFMFGENGALNVSTQFQNPFASIDKASHEITFGPQGNANDVRWHERMAGLLPSGTPSPLSGWLDHVAKVPTLMEYKGNQKPARALEPV